MIKFLQKIPESGADPDYHQNLIVSSVAHVPLSLEFYEIGRVIFANKQTNKLTN